MIVPRSRLLWLTSLWVTPALTLVGLGGRAQVIGVVLSVVALALIVTDWALSSDCLHAVTAKFEGPIHAIVGRPFELKWTLESMARIPRLRLEFDLPAEFEELRGPTEHGATPSAREGTSARSFDARYAIRERGRFSLQNLHVECPSHLGLLGIRTALSVDVQVHAYPDLAKDRRQLAAQNFAKELGVMAITQVGRGRAFDRLRDYVPGDEMDDIHWRATAKRRRPTTKLYQLEKDQRVYVAIDHSRLSGRPSPREDAETSTDCLLERYIGCALLLGSVAQAQGDKFGLLGFGDRVTRFTAAGSGPLHYRACREAIMNLHPERVNPDYRELFGQFASQERRRSLLFVLTSVDDPALCEELIESVQIIAKRHLVVAAAVRPAEARSLSQAEPVSGPPEIVDRLAAHLQWKRLQNTAHKLRKSGIRYLSLEHQTMVPLVVGSYTAIKRGQLL